jgi:hypothetical protein
MGVGVEGTLYRSFWDQREINSLKWSAEKVK